MKKNRLNTLLCLIIGIQMIFSFSPAVSYGQTVKDYPYAIQLGVFNNSVSAQNFIKAHKTQIGSAFYLKFVNYHVFYNAYATKEQAVKDLNQARKVSSEAYVVRIKSENQQSVNDYMNQMVKGNALIKNTATTAQNSSNVSSETSSSKTQVYNQVLDKDLTVNGVFGERIIYFNVDPSWKVSQNTYFDVYLDYPEKSFYSDSALSFLLNDVPVYSVTFNDKNSKLTHVRVPLDPSKMNTGSNSIKIKSFIRTAEDLCENQTNPANWIVFQKKSYIHIEYANQPYNMNLSEFPYPYLVAGDDKPVKFEFIYDDKQASSDIIKGIVALTADFGRLNPFKTLNYDFVTPTNYQGAKPAIYVGQAVPASIQKWLDPKIKLPQSDLYVIETKTTQNSNLLLIIAKDPKQLKALAHMLSYNEVISQIDGNQMTFTPEDFLDAKVAPQDNLITLEDLGYGNSLFEGSKNPTVNYFVNLPGNWKLTEGTKLILNVRFSSLVDASNSTVTATVNDIPIGSQKLDSSFASGQVLEFNLPKQVLDGSKFNIGLSFSLGGEYKCSDLKSTKGFWAFVSNNSYLEIAKTDKQLYTLEDLPSPIVKDQSFDRLTISLPKNPDLNTVKFLSNLMSKFGQQTLNLGAYDVVFDQRATSGNNLVIGTAKDPIIQNTNDLAVIPYNSSFSAFTRKEGIALLSSEMANYATVQLISNEKESLNTLWITSQTSEGFNWLSKYMTDTGLSLQVKGDAIFVSRNGTIQVYENPENISASKDKQTSKSEVTRATFENMVGFLLFLGSLLVVTVLLIVFMGKKRKQ